jgi:hypothetical protein
MFAAAGDRLELDEGRSPGRPIQALYFNACGNTIHGTGNQ